MALTLTSALVFQVDNNVTRHLEAELGPSDWDVLILHYLGLDHIGHLAGPLSPLAPVKLQEMDDIVKWIYQSVSEQVKELCCVLRPHCFS